MNLPDSIAMRPVLAPALCAEQPHHSDAQESRAFIGESGDSGARARRLRSNAHQRPDTDGSSARVCAERTSASGEDKPATESAATGVAD
jgi:hypothetical protein